MIWRCYWRGMSAENATLETFRPMVEHAAFSHLVNFPSFPVRIFCSYPVGTWCTHRAYLSWEITTLGCTTLTLLIWEQTPVGFGCFPLVGRKTLAHSWMFLDWLGTETMLGHRPIVNATKTLKGTYGLGMTVLTPRWAHSTNTLLGKFGLGTECLCPVGYGQL